MEEDLKSILEEYIKCVENLCNNLLGGINYSENLDLKNKKDFFAYRTKGKHMSFSVQGVTYILHGVGCTAFNDDMYINWDFGYRSRWCGIDPWKVAMTLKKNKNVHIKYYNGDLIKNACDQMVNCGIMFKKNTQYYFAILENETFKPNFPIEYDTLIVEYYNSQWTIPRNKLTDRFIRKSIYISNKIYNNEDRYTLKFLLGDEEIYVIPYSDIYYPENAVKIMSDIILRNF